MVVLFYKIMTSSSDIPKKEENKIQNFKNKEKEKEVILGCFIKEVNLL